MIYALISIPTSLGSFGAAFSPEGLGYLSYPSQPPQQAARWLARWHPQATISTTHPLAESLTDQLQHYLDGRLQQFDLPLDLQGTTFQRHVWQALLQIPYGHTMSYQQLAIHLGRPRAARAVGAANAVNPIPIIVPCHRLIGSHGQLTGYGGGLSLKQTLLSLEQAKRPML